LLLDTGLRHGQICALSRNSICLCEVERNSFPLTVGRIAHRLALDFDVNSSVQNNLSITPTLTHTATVAADGELEEEQDLKARSLQLGVSIHIAGRHHAGRYDQCDSNTEFKDFSEIGCTTNDSPA